MAWNWLLSLIVSVAKVSKSRSAMAFCIWRILTKEHENESGVVSFLDEKKFNII